MEARILISMENGWIKMDRSVMDTWVYQNPEAFLLYAHLYFMAAFEERETVFAGEVIRLKPGQLITGRKQLSAQTKLSEQTIRSLLSKLEKNGNINQLNTAKGSLISINYGIFEKKTTSYQPTDNQLSTNYQPTTNQLSTTIKEIKKERTKELKKNINSEIELKLDIQDAIIVNHELIDWIGSNCKRVAKMKRPLTNDTAEKLCDEFGIQAVQEVILAMENWEPLHKKSVDTNLTCRNWLNRRNNAKPSNTNTYPTNGNTISRSDGIKQWVENQRNNPFLFGSQDQNL